MAEGHHDNHGQTPAAWTAVTIMLVGFIVGSIAVIQLNWVLLGIGTVVIVVESVAREPQLVAERDGLLHPPAFAVVKAKASDGTAPGERVESGAGGAGIALAPSELRPVGERAVLVKRQLAVGRPADQL